MAMKLQRFFIDKQLTKNSEITVIDKNLSEQIRRVFRMRAGDRVALLDNSGNGLEAEIIDFGRDLIDFFVSDVEVSSFVPPKDMWIFVSIPKKDKFELVVQKATELGVSHIVPVISERTEKQNIKWDRVAKIAKEASEQSERGVLPVIHEIQNLEDVLSEYDDIKVLHMDGEKTVSDLKDSDSPKVLIGPEGGWGENDLELFTEYNTDLVSLGDQVLRAETASIAVASVLLL